MVPVTFWYGVVRSMRVDNLIFKKNTPAIKFWLQSWMRDGIVMDPVQMSEFQKNRMHNVININTVRPQCSTSSHNNL